MVQIEGLAKAIEQLEKERAVPKEALFAAVEAALLSASKKALNCAPEQKLLVQINRETGLIKVFAYKKVVAEPVDPNTEITLVEAQKIKKDAVDGEEIEIDVTPHNFGRLAAQTAKQVIIQKIREAEKETTFEEFKKKEGSLVGGVIQRQEFKNYLVNLGRLEAILPVSEQIPGEFLKMNERVKFYLMEVKKTPKGPAVIISRSHPGLVKKLFEMEVPEIAEGVIEIKAIAREAGRRTKIAVYSYDEKIVAVGTCIGYMGGRIQNVLKELGREKVDIIEYNGDTKTFITNALKPAKISQITLDGPNKSARVIVADDQLSLAIGRDGQNVRLASKLTGWRVDIVSENEAKKKGLKTPVEGADTLEKTLKPGREPEAASETKKKKRQKNPGSQV